MLNHLTHGYLVTIRWVNIVQAGQSSPGPPPGPPHGGPRGGRGGYGTTDNIVKITQCYGQGPIRVTPGYHPNPNVTGSIPPIGAGWYPLYHTGLDNVTACIQCFPRGRVRLVYFLHQRHGDSWGSYDFFSNYLNHLIQGVTPPGEAGEYPFAETSWYNIHCNSNRDTLRQCKLSLW